MRNRAAVLSALLLAAAALPVAAQDARHEPTFEEMVARTRSDCNEVDVRLLIAAQERWPEMADTLARLARDPGNARLHNSLGNHYVRRLMFDAAKASYECAVHLNEHLAPAWNNLGLILLARREIPASVEALENAVAADPNYAKAHYHLGVAYDAGRQYDRALHSYERAITLDPRLGTGEYNPIVVRNPHRIPLFLRQLLTEEAVRFHLGAGETD